MTDATNAMKTLDEKADSILAELGLDPEGPPEQFTHEAGLEVGRRFREIFPIDQAVLDELLRDLLRDALNEFASIFPTEPDTETIEFQAYLLGPFVSTLLVGRGLTVPEMATLARVSPQHTYRLNRKGLSIIYTKKEPPLRTGVNRRFSGRDDRETHLSLDIQNFSTKPWPEPVAGFQPFVQGLMEGIPTWINNPAIRVQFEHGLESGFANLLSDPGLGELFDGLILALHRIAQGLRGEVYRLNSERERAQGFEDFLTEAAKRRGEILAVLSKAGRTLASTNRKAIYGGHP